MILLKEITALVVLFCTDASPFVFFRLKMTVRKAYPACLMDTCLMVFIGLPAHRIISMPALSPTMTQGNLASWKKKIGDEIKVGESIALIETDKATMDLESQEEGYLAKILVPDGTNDVSINVPIAVIVENKQDVPQMKDFSPEGTPVKGRCFCQAIIECTGKYNDRKGKSNR